MALSVNATISMPPEMVEKIDEEARTNRSMDERQPTRC
nr:ribbon-helix-helix domain-containing protein [Halogeometricum borinquense]